MKVMEQAMTNTNKPRVMRLACNARAQKVEAVGLRLKLT